MDSPEDPPTLVNPRIFELEVKPKLILSHEIGAGSQCTKCSCPGLDLHYWRKRCKNCSCKLEDHDVILETDHAQILIGRLFGVHEIFEGRITSSIASSITNSHSINEPSYAIPFKQSPIRSTPSAVYNVRMENPSNEEQNNKSTTEYAWIPLEDPRIVEKYMDSLPLNERPIIGSEGEKNRKKRLTHQLPLFDFDLNNKMVSDEKEKESLNKFITNIRQNIVGVGEIVEVDRDKYIDRATKNLSIHPSHEHYDENGMRTILPTDCKTCNVKLVDGDIAVATSHGKKEDSWHPKCFRCCICNDLLADLIYFYHNGDYYCGRHFAEKQYPRCSGCDELIFAKEYTLAEEKSWHFEHFACDKCDLRLGGHRYITKDDQPHCLQCYLKHYAKTCGCCNGKISADEKRLNYGDKHWHATKDCFRCEECKKNLIGDKFLLKENIIFCSAKCKIDHSSK